MRKTIENFGVASWFLMDVCWMLNWISFAYFFMIITIVFFSTPPQKENKKYSLIEFAIYISTLGWVLMNASWMVNESTNHIFDNLFKIIQYFSLLIGGCGFLIISFLDIKKFKNIRRFKK